MEIPCIFNQQDLSILEQKGHVLIKSKPLFLGTMTFYETELFCNGQAQWGKKNHFID